MWTHIDIDDINIITEKVLKSKYPVYQTYTPNTSFGIVEVIFIWFNIAQITNTKMLLMIS